MRGCVFAVTCLFWASHGRRVQSSIEQFKTLKSGDTVTKLNAPAEVKQSQSKEAIPSHVSLKENSQRNKGSEPAQEVQRGNEEQRSGHSENEPVKLRGPSSPSLTQTNSVRSLLKSWFPALGVQGQPFVGNKDIRSSRSIYGSAVLFVAFLVCSTYFMRHTRNGSKCDNYSVDVAEQTLGTDADMKTSWRKDWPSLPILSAKLEAWNAKHTAGEADPFLLSDDKSRSISPETGPETDATYDLCDASETESSIPASDIVAPVTLDAGGANMTLLKYTMAKSLLKHLPARLRVPGAVVWRLCYKPSAHGTSMATLHRMISGCERSVLIIRDADDHVFGGFAPAAWQVSRRFHGSGEAFLFTFGKLVDRSNGAESEDEDGRSLDTPTASIFQWTSSNRHFMYLSHELIAMGGGDGRYGLAVHKDILHGHSTATPTFGNPPLSSAPGGEFVVKDMELWSLESLESSG